MSLTFQLHPLPDGDGKTSNRKAKHDDSNPGAHLS